MTSPRNSHVLLSVLTAATVGVVSAIASDPPANPTPVSPEERADREIVQVERWGFNSDDSTDAIQQAINSGARTVVIPHLGEPWIVRPLKLRSNLTLRLQPGVILEAKRGAYRDKQDSLLILEELQNVQVVGTGATLRMFKDDYGSGVYEKSEWRHGISIKGSKNIEVIGLRTERAGGDGIYIGPTWDKRHVPSENVTVRDCVCSESLRQGISIVSGRQIRIENCLLEKSSGAAPQAGLDVEPSNADDLAIDIEVVNCRAIGNSGSGFMVNFSRLTSNSSPVSVRFANCQSRGSVQPGLRALLDRDLGATGTVEFIDCTVEETQLAGLALRWDTNTGIKLDFTRCHWSNVALRNGEPAIDLDLRSPSGGRSGAGVRFITARLTNHLVDREVVRLIKRGPFPVSGELEVYGEKPAEVISYLPDFQVTYKGRHRDP